MKINFADAFLYSYHAAPLATQLYHLHAERAAWTETYLTVENQCIKCQERYHQL